MGNRYTMLDPSLPSFLKELDENGQIKMDTREIQEIDGTIIRILIYKYEENFWVVHKEDDACLECFAL